MKRMLWTCAAGVLALVCACDKGEEPTSERAAEEECERGCGEEAQQEVAKPLDAELVAAIVREDRPVQGKRDAKIEVFVWNDFACPFCRKEVAVLEELLDAYPNDVKLVFKQFPLAMHDAAPAAARASLAAQRQGKFWEMHDALFEQPERVANREFSAIAKEVGLDVGRFERDLEDPSIVLAVERDMEDGRELGIRGTPSIVVGDKLVIGAQPLATLREVVDAELARAG
jgi:protein-disulfide isomerase